MGFERALVQGLSRRALLRSGRTSADCDLFLVEELCERKRAMTSRWDQVVLPVGRLQDRVDAGVGRMRRNRERRSWKVPVHRQPDIIESLDGWLELEWIVERGPNFRENIRHT